MERSEIEHHILYIRESIDEGRIRYALERIAFLTRHVSLPDAFYTLQSLEENYFNLVRYAVEGYKDPSRAEILQGISAAALSLTDDLQEALMLRFLPLKRSEKARLASTFGTDASAISSRVEEFLVQRQLDHMISESAIGEAGTHEMISTEDIFKLVWLADKLQEYHVRLIEKVNGSAEIPWTEKCLLVSALTLSFMNHFDIRKAMLLLDLLENREPQVFQRALIGLVLGLILYDRRLELYPEFRNRIQSLAGDETFRKEAEMVILQLLTARETERITQEFEKEVLPDMQKMMPRIEDRLQLGEPGEEPGMEDKNPVWKEMMDEVPGLYEKIEKFSKMQMEGADVFMGTFSKLKRFDFFNSMSNWFVPFFKENPLLSTAEATEGSYEQRLYEGLENAFYICNSDKYSFAFNFMAIPAQQRSMIVTYFESELSQMKEMASEEQLLDQSLLSNAITVQYIQDLYRFFKLYPGRTEFTDPFQAPMDFRSLHFAGKIFEEKVFLEKIASFYFEKDHWPEAISLYGHLATLPEPRAEFFQKSAYACQMAGRFREAVEFYRKAELFDSDRPWILRKLGWCYMKLGEYSEAARCFELALELNPADTGIRMQIAKCQLGERDYEAALKTYSGLRFFEPSNLRVLRPIAFCQFATGDLPAAEATYAEILENEGRKTMYDFMNAGHVRLCQGKTEEALELYRQSLQGFGPPWVNFFEAFEEDVPLFTKNGIPPEEIPLLRDYLAYQFGNR